ncbi:MAG TPA: hypothetical protein VIM70_22450 [Clostridium sp.]
MEYKIGKKIVINLLMGVKIDNKKIDVEKDFTFLSQDGLNTQLLITDLEAEEYIDLAIKSSIKKYTKSKATAIAIYKEFIMTQVITTLEGLKIMSEKEAYKNYALNGAKTIWIQLSDYAKHRIYTVSEGLGIDISWYKSLEMDISNLFHSEYMCSTIYGCQSLLLCYKNSRPCFIEYIDDDGKTIIYKNCLIISCPDDRVTVKMGEKQLILETERVIKAALTENELY